MSDHQSQSNRLEKIATVAIVIIMTISIGFALSVLKAILMPFIIAILLAYLFSPLVETAAKKWHVRRPLSIFIIFFFIFILTAWLGTFLVQNTKEFIADWPTYQKELELNIEKIAVRTQLNRTDIVQFLENTLKNLPFSQSFTNMMVFLVNILLSLLFMAFILLSVHTIPNKLYHAFSKKRAAKISIIINNINKQIQQYLAIKTLVSFLTGISVYVALFLLDINFAFLWATLAFFLNYIPNIGSFIAGIPPIVTALLQYDIVKALIVLAIFVFLQFLWGNVVEPLIIGKKLNLSPIVVLLSLLFWGWLWGIVGAIIAVPIMAIMKITFSNIPGLKPIAILMSDNDNNAFK